MIHSIEMHNFQSHKETKLELVEGVNAIVGPSDSGKTSIIRALRWLIQNRPSGEAFRSHWGGDTSILIDVDVNPDGFVSHQLVQRIRAKDYNGYVLTTDEFKAIKSEVPIEIQQALNITDINIQMQMDGPFLLNESAGKVAEHFNKVARLDIIDTAIGNVKKWIREITGDISTNTNRLEQLAESLTEYDHLEALEKEIAQLEKLEQHQTNIEADTDKLYALVNAIQSTEIETQKHDKLLNLQKPVAEAIVLVQQRKGLAVREKDLSSFISQCKRTKQVYIKGSHKLKQLKERFTQEFPDVCPLCGKEK